MSDQNKNLKQSQEIAQRVQGSLQNTLLSQARDHEELFFKELVQGSRAEHNKLPEEVFVKNFLPYFSGQQTIKENPDVIPAWIGVAGSPTAEVDIVDAAGQTVFTVPAHMDTTIINATARFQQGGTLTQAMNQFELEKNNLPTLAQTRAAQEMHSRTTTMIQGSSAAEENRKAWDLIFTRYNLPNPYTAKTNHVAKASPPAVDDVEYD